jgi:hypothetical protein
MTMHELWIDGVGLVHIGGHHDDDELERLLRAMYELPVERRGAHVEMFSFEDDALGIVISGLQLVHARLTAVDVARMFVAEARVMKSTVELRARWARTNGAPFVAVPGTQTACRVCLSCGDELPVWQLFGRCRTCSIVLHTVSMEADVALPERQRQ